MQEYDLNSLNGIFKRVGKMVDKDPLLGQADSLAKVQKNFEDVAQAIKGNGDRKERSAGIMRVFSSWLNNDESFQFASFEGKIASIFTQYDLILSSIVNVGKIYAKVESELRDELISFKEYLDNLDRSELDDDENRIVMSYDTMVMNLELNYKRLSMQIKSINLLNKTMTNGRPAFEIILSGCMLEVAGNRTVEASGKIMDIMTSTTEGLSDTLTTQTINQSKMAIETGSRPALSAPSITKNIAMLEEAKETFIESRRIASEIFSESNLINKK